MGKAIKCTITGLEIGEETFYYVARYEDRIGLISIKLSDVKKDDVGPYTAIFDTVKESKIVLRIIKLVLKDEDPDKNIFWSINRLIPKYQRVNNRISLKDKTRSIG